MSKKGFSHGIAAKLINLYLKAIFVCGMHETNPRVAAFHPAIDRKLLEELRKNNVGNRKHIWNHALEIGWTRFSSPQYQRIIDAIRASIPNKPLWHIEEHWPGNQ